MQNIKYQNLQKKIDLNSVIVLASISPSIDQVDNMNLRNDLEYLSGDIALGKNVMFVSKRSLANFFFKSNNIDFVFPKNRHACFVVGDNIALACKALLKNSNCAQIH